MVEVRKSFCDVCLDAGTERPGIQYRVSDPRRTAQVDLCDKHAGALIRLLEAFPFSAGQTRPRGGGAARRTSRGLRVTTLEEIEAIKARERRT
jgi:hypothetical protein